MIGISVLFISGFWSDSSEGTQNNVEIDTEVMFIKVKLTNSSESSIAWIIDTEPVQ